MQKIIFLAIFSAFVILACSTKEESVQLEPGSPAYELAKELAQKLPGLDPDENKVIVKTKDFEVTSGEVVQVIYTRIGNRQGGLKSQTAEQLRQIFVDNGTRIAEQKLLVKAAEKANISVSQSEIDSVLNDRYQRFRGEDKYKEYLQKSDISFDAMLQDMKEGLVIKKFIDQEVANPDNISKEEIAAVYDQEYGGDRNATVRHILLMTQGKNDEEKAEIRKKMEDILQQARSGSDFAKLAQQYSEDPGSKNRGGLYEKFERGTMVKPFEDASFNLPVGSISDIVETQYGLHIIKVEAREKDNRPLDDVKNAITKKVREDKINAYVENLKTSVSFENLGI